MWISKKKYEELIKRINTIEEKTSKFTPYGLKWFDQCRDDINDIQRVMKNSKLGEITFKSIFDKTLFIPYEEHDKSKNYTLIYKDFKEYKIDGLYLYKPIFTVDENNNNLIYVKDKCYVYDGEVKKEANIEFIVDLQKQTFIRTK